MDDTQETAGLPAVMPESEVKPFETTALPTFAFVAALSIADAKRGIHVHGNAEEVRLTVTDGHRAFVYSRPLAAAAPEWLAAGVVLHVDLLADRIKMIDKLGHDVAEVGYQSGASTVILSDPADDVVFRLTPILGGQYPNVQQVIDRLSFGARQTLDIETLSFDSGYLRSAVQMARLLGMDESSFRRRGEKKRAPVIRLFGGSGREGEPLLIDFPDCPGAVMLLMQRQVDPVIAPQTARLLEAPVAGTVAALRAHRTRQEQKLAKAATESAKRTIRAKIEEYDQRIDAILGRTRTALPKPPAPPAVDDDEADRFDEHAADGPVADATPAVFQRRLRQQQRARLNGVGRQREQVRFHADINAILSREHDLTIDGLADGVPLDEWFANGMSPAEAAARCLDWRTK